MRISFRYTTSPIGGVIALLLLVMVGPAGCDREPAQAPPATAERMPDPQLADLSEKFNVAVENRREAGVLLDETQRAIKQYPTDPRLHLLLGQMLLRANQAEAAAEAIETSLELDPQQPEVHILAGSIAMLRFDDSIAALQHYRRAIELNPRSGRYRLHLANIYLRQQQYEQAERVLRDAIALDASLHAAYAGLADIHAQRSEWNAAVVQIQRAEKLVPVQDWRTRLNYIRKHGWLLREKGDPAGALMVLSQVASWKPPRQFETSVMKDLAACWQAMGQPGKAAAHYALALQLDPTHDLAAAEAARWYLRAGQVQDARTMLDRLRRINPASPQREELERLLHEAEREQDATGTALP